MIVTFAFSSNVKVPKSIAFKASAKANDSIYYVYFLVRYYEDTTVCLFLSNQHRVPYSILIFVEILKKYAIRLQKYFDWKKTLEA